MLPRQGKAKAVHHHQAILYEMLKVKDKEKILKAAREKKIVTYRGVP